MDKQQSNRAKKVSKATASQSPKHGLAQPKKGSPMERFNNTLRKILSAPKKNLKDK